MMVFPLGMYGEASRDLGHELGLPPLAALSASFLVMGVAAWTVTAAGLGRSLWAAARAQRGSCPSRGARPGAAVGTDPEVAPEQN
jgi:hypothetical protein